MSNAWVGEPRRHRSILCSLANAVSKGPRLSVRFEWRRRNSSISMANLTMFLENGQHITRKSNRVRGRILRGVCFLAPAACKQQYTKNRNDYKVRHAME